jgi:hypothetical protein
MTIWTTATRGETIRLLGPLFALLLPLAAAAQVDPDADGIGFYFDTAATLTSATVPVIPPGEAQLSVWLVATRMSVPGFIRHFEGVVEWDYIDNLVFRGMSAGFDLCWEMPVSYRDVMCTDIEPGTLATSDAVVLGRYDAILYGDQVPVRFYIREFRLWLDGGTEIAQHPSSGDWELPVAVINGPAPVAIQSAAWGAVKSLYR